ncbi:MAG TPA: M20/M25/M40 family metallo-hydrolase, partial [Acidobacteriota bacterium]
MKFANFHSKIISNMIVRTFLLCVLLTANWTSAADLQINAKRMEDRIAALSQFGKNPEGGVSRVAFSDADIQGRNYIQTLMKAAKLQVRIDTAGNIIGRREGKDPSLAPILFGSHIDSVPGGGNYDGDVGVLAALECIEVLNESNQITQHPLEVVVFSDEEGGLVGSRSMAGEFHESAMEIRSHSGKTIREGIRAIGGDPDRIHEAQRTKRSITAYLEL